MKSVFVTGTDTGIGKTIASAWLCHHWQADYWKPVQSGTEDGTDSATVATLAQCEVHPEAYRLSAPLSPHQSAALDGVNIELKQFVLPKADRLVVEGAGGCMVPLNWQHTLIDLMQHLALPVLLVARSGLGTINHTCLSVQALRTAKVPVLGVLMMGPANAANRQAIEHFAKTPVLAELPHWRSVGTNALANHPMPIGLRQALEGLG
ncbi:dethiobiotin synthase [Limnobacter sp.]|uniref:dethiobiotin synthase n=1 Tax=Limnobacter sp. TaxID=2003368 RepID=UPI00351610FD